MVSPITGLQEMLGAGEIFQSDEIGILMEGVSTRVYICQNLLNILALNFIV